MADPKKPVARGVGRGQNLQFKCTLDRETFNEVRRRAVQQKTSMAEQIRLLVEWGLESASA